MSGRKNTLPVHEAFEGSDPRGQWTKITRSMQNSVAWGDLTFRQRGLYLHLKSKYTATIYGKGEKRRKVSDNARNISMPAEEARKYYGNLVTFRADIDKLIACGFIDCVCSGFNTRKASIYGFSDRWQQYSQPDYQVPKNAVRPVRSPKKEKSKPQTDHNI